MTWYGRTLARPWRRATPESPRQRLAAMRQGFQRFKIDYAELLFLGDAWAVQELARREELIAKEK